MVRAFAMFGVSILKIDPKIKCLSLFVALFYTQIHFMDKGLVPPVGVEKKRDSCKILV